MRLGESGSLRRQQNKREGTVSKCLNGELQIPTHTSHPITKTGHALLHGRLKTIQLTVDPVTKIRCSQS